MRNIKGTYTLIVFVAGRINLGIGSLGTFAFEKGWHAYTGSARGPAGLLGRIRRHLKKDKKPFWHIDYLLKSRHSSIRAIVYTKVGERHECKIVKEIGEKNVKPIKGFGASDCNKGCKSHLCYMNDDFEATLKSILDAYGNLNLIASLRLF
ncbi:MAG: GIY-YIG nuclease family protein [Nitrososphaerales archaeon]|nr:GIY-YIG nuclease family protein [Nitrososphaerales archaeon]